MELDNIRKVALKLHPCRMVGGHVGRMRSFVEQLQRALDVQRAIDQAQAHRTVEEERRDEDLHAEVAADRLLKHQA